MANVRQCSWGVAREKGYMKTKSTERLKWLDTVRGIAILCVIMCHVVEGGIYELTVRGMQSVGTISKLFAFVMFSIGRLGVPFFLLTSGYLLLDKEYNDKACKNFWKSKCCGLLIAIEFWIVIYNVFLHFFYGVEISLIGTAKEMLLLKSSPMNHMWYMPMILGMYITIPFVANALHTIELKTIAIPCTVLILCFFVIPTANILFQACDMTLGNTIVSAGFSGGVYGMYLVTGYLLKKKLLKQIQTRILVVCASLSFVCAIVMQVFSYNRNVAYNLWYNNLFLFMCGVSVFELMERIRHVHRGKIIFAIAKYSFAIYLVHNPINMILTRCSSFVTVRPVRVLLVWIATVFLSTLVTVIINRIPKVGKIILYMR